MHALVGVYVCSNETIVPVEYMRVLVCVYLLMKQ